MTITKSILILSLLALVSVAASGTANANMIFKISGDITQATGPDVYGLDGAHFLLLGHFTLTNYVNNFGFPSILADDLNVTVSGSSVAANNGTYDLFAAPNPGASAFYPTLGQLQIFPGGAPFKLNTPVGSPPTIDPQFVLTPSASGALATIGGAAQISDFLATPGGLLENRWSDFISVNYNVSNVVISANDVSAVPEPASVALFGAGLLAMAVLRRHRL